ncbi:MAG: hypothetical protein CMC15_14860 [Flavobacteriaceae bacterium]|nr:hypothetical protein [Flavobacteriaceae bacterium]|tara:strand:- start:565 stop:1044 length:480 start_codon:yes stop_codon:yes gene_type:complete
MARQSPQSNKFLNNVIRTGHIKDDAVTNAKTDANQSKMLVFAFDGSSLTAGAKTLTTRTGTAQQLPAGAIIKSWYIDVQVPFASSGSATIALGVTGSASAIVGATAYDNAAMVAATAGWEFAALGVKLDAAKDVLLTIGTAALTAGVADVYIEYVEEAA